jgi:hypothetical protein
LGRRSLPLPSRASAEVAHLRVLRRPSRRGAFVVPSTKTPSASRALRPGASVRVLSRLRESRGRTRRTTLGACAVPREGVAVEVSGDPSRRTMFVLGPERRRGAPSGTSSSGMGHVGCGPRRVTHLFGLRRARLLPRTGDSCADKAPVKRLDEPPEGGRVNRRRCPRVRSSSESPCGGTYGTSRESPDAAGTRPAKESLKAAGPAAGPAPLPHIQRPHERRRQEMTPTDVRRKIRNFPAANLLVKLAASYAAS